MDLEVAASRKLAAAPLASGCRLADLLWLGFVNWRLFASQPFDRKERDAQLLDQKIFLACLGRTDGPRDNRSELENAVQAVVLRPEPLREKRMGGPHGPMTEVAKVRSQNQIKIVERPSK